jgi:HAD superfamily hydrolase (TIGR01484 family)
VRPLAELGAAEARGLRGVLFDLDDTLLTHGRLTREAYGALWDLHDGGLRLVAVTGRPSGWGEVLVRHWPIDGAVTENGAVHVLREGDGVAKRDACEAHERRARRLGLKRLVEEVHERVPEARLTDDVDARRSDVTWDIGEREHLADETIRVIEGLISRAGARSLRSSVHLHATFDVDDKASGSVAFLRATFAEDVGAALTRYAYVGDSSNDAACFAAFRTTVGVANVRRSAEQIIVSPRYVAALEMGAGFAEIASSLLALRRG